MKIFASHNPDEKIRRESSAGGIFSMLAEHVLSEGGVVYGAAFGQEWNVRHIRIDTVDELWRLRGSKYVFSDFKCTPSEIENDIENGRKVLFSGTPCQVAAIRKRLGNHPLLLLVETVCHGAPDARYWEQYLEELLKKLRRKPTDIASINFRDKRTGWKNYSFTIAFNDGGVFSQPHDDNLYMRAFLQDLTLRKSCFVCPFKYPNGSKADITIGDFWGISQLAPEIDNDLGTTIVIARTEKGMSYTDFLRNDCELNLENAALYNPAITSSATKPCKREAFEQDADKNKLLPLFSRYAKRPFRQTLYLKLARLKHKLLNQ